MHFRQVLVLVTILENLWVLFPSKQGSVKHFLLEVVEGTGPELCLAIRAFTFSRSELLSDDEFAVDLIAEVAFDREVYYF